MDKFIFGYFYHNKEVIPITDLALDAHFVPNGTIGFTIIGKFFKVVKDGFPYKELLPKDIPNFDEIKAVMLLMGIPVHSYTPLEIYDYKISDSSGR